MSTLIVPSRFNGPPASGNGGYSSGVIAALFDGPCAVSLRRPVPLDQPLDVEAANGLASGIAGDANDSEVLRVSAAGEVIAEAVAAPELAPWSGPAVDLEAARDATSRFVPPASGFFDHCFVCGRERHDGFCVFPGRAAGDDFVASTWTPPEWAADDDGAVLAEFVWAVLDCPGYFALHGHDGSLAFLARQQSTIVAAATRRRRVRRGRDRARTIRSKRDRGDGDPRCRRRGPRALRADRGRASPTG